MSAKSTPKGTLVLTARNSCKPDFGLLTTKPLYKDSLINKSTQHLSRPSDPIYATASLQSEIHFQEPHNKYRKVSSFVPLYAFK